MIDYAFATEAEKQQLKQSRVFCMSVCMKLEGEESRQDIWRPLFLFPGGLYARPSIIPYLCSDTVLA